MDFSTRHRHQQLSLSSIGTHIAINLFLCVLIWILFDIDFDNQRLYILVSFLYVSQTFVEIIRVMSQNYAIVESKNITRIVLIILIITLMIFAIVFSVSLIIAWFALIDNYKILDILYLAIILGILAIMIICSKDSRLFRLVHYLTKFAVRKIPKILSFINSILGAKHFPVRSLFVLLINASTLVNVIASAFVLLILSVILHDPNNLTAAKIILYLLASSMIVSLVRIFMEMKLTLKANKLYRQGNELFKQEIETSKIQAIDIFEQALLLYKKTNYQIWAAITLNNIGLVYNTLEEKQTALDYFNKSLNLFQEMKNFLGEAMTLNNIGLVYDTLGKKQTALDYFNQSLDLFQKIPDRGSITNTLYNLAVLRYKQGNLNEALIKIESAIKIIEELYTEIIITNLSKSYFATVQNYYQFYIDLLVKLHKHNPNQGYDIKASEVIEKLKNLERNLTIISGYS